MTVGASIIGSWKADPKKFMWECFRATPEKWQAELLDNFVKQKKCALISCKGSGKTAIEAILGWNFLFTRRMSEVYATSITGKNLQDGLWKEFAKWYQRSPILQREFEFHAQRIIHRTCPTNWFGSARTWERQSSSDQQSESSAGMHADYIMGIIDEISGVPDGVVAAYEAMLSSAIEAKLLVAGNPTRASGPLFRIGKKEPSKWFIVYITGDPEDPNRCDRVDKAWAQEQIDKWGRDNPYVLVNVFGQFPPSDINALFGPSDLEAAARRRISDNETGYAQRRLGVDVARFGLDSTVIAQRSGLKGRILAQLRHMDTNQLLPRVIEAIKKTRSEIEHIDGTGGYGAGLVDALRAQGRTPIEVMSNGKADDERRFFNKRSEMYWRMSEWIKRAQIDNDRELMDELEAHTYTYVGDRLYVEAKEQVKDRLGRSPDKSDALALTFAVPEMNTAFAMSEGSEIPDEIYQRLIDATNRNRRSDSDHVDYGEDYDPFKTRW